MRFYYGQYRVVAKSVAGEAIVRQTRERVSNQERREEEGRKNRYKRDTRHPNHPAKPL